MLIYNKIAPYLQQTNNTERLNYARQCFYLKIMGDMEANPQQQKLQDRLTLLTDVTHPNDISIKIVGYENT